jgi:hypothetical protein
MNVRKMPGNMADRHTLIRNRPDRRRSGLLREFREESGEKGPNGISGIEVTVSERVNGPPARGTPFLVTRKSAQTYGNTNAGTVENRVTRTRHPPYTRHTSRAAIEPTARRLEKVDE